MAFGNKNIFVVHFCGVSRSSDGRKTGSYSNFSHNNPGMSGQSSPRPVVTPRTHTASNFIGPQLPPHMTKVMLKMVTLVLWPFLWTVFFLTVTTCACVLFLQSAPHVNGNGSLKDYPSSSKASTSSSAVGKPPSSVSHSISRPTMIPDQDKRQKLSFFIGQGKQNRAAPSSSYSQPSSASSSSSSSSQSTSDTCFFPHQLNHINGTSCSNGDHPAGNGTSFLVPYSQESSEESDQENGGTLDNVRLSKSQTKENNNPADVFPGSPKNTDGESEVHKNGNELNGPSCGDSKSTQKGHVYGHHQMNGHNPADKVDYRCFLQCMCSVIAFNYINEAVFLCFLGLYQ